MSLKRLPRFRESSVLIKSKRPCPSRAIRSQNCSLPPHQRFHVFRPLISFVDSAMPPSIFLKTSSANSGKSLVVRPPPSSTRETFRLQPIDNKEAPNAKRQNHRTPLFVIARSFVEPGVMPFVP